MLRTTETLRTCLMAGLTAGLLVTGLSAYAFAIAPPPPPRSPAAFDAYLRHGTAEAEEALRRDLGQRFPAGSNAGALLARLQAGGFECRVVEEQPGAYNCVYRRPLAFDRSAEISTRVLTEGTRLVGLAPSRDEDTMLASRAEPRSRQRNG